LARRNIPDGVLAYRERAKRYNLAPCLGATAQQENAVEEQLIDASKAEWIKPELVELSLKMDQVETGYRHGTDAIHGGHSTSLS
jgi:hypothetical protein